MEEYYELSNAIINLDEARAIELLQTPRINDFIADDDNYILRMSADKCLNDLIEKLLEIPAVRANAAAANNYCLQILATDVNGLKGVRLLLTVPCVVEKIHAEKSYALRYAAGAGILPIVRCLREKIVDNQDLAALKGAIKSAFRNDHKLIGYELHKLLGAQGCAVMQKKWRNKLQNSLSEVLTDKVALALFYRNTKRAPIVGTTNYIDKLPNELCRKIAEYNLGELPTDPNKKDLLHLYMYASNQDYTFLLEDAVNAVDRMAAKHVSTLSVV